MRMRPVSHSRGRSVRQVPPLTVWEAFYKDVIGVCVSAVPGPCRLVTPCAPPVGGPGGGSCFGTNLAAWRAPVEVEASGLCALCSPGSRDRASRPQEVLVPFSAGLACRAPRASPVVLGAPPLSGPQVRGEQWHHVIETWKMALDLRSRAFPSVTCSRSVWSVERCCLLAWVQVCWGLTSVRTWVLVGFVR